MASRDIRVRSTKRSPVPARKRERPSRKKKVCLHPLAAEREGGRETPLPVDDTVAGNLARARVAVKGAPHLPCGAGMADGKGDHPVGDDAPPRNGEKIGIDGFVEGH